MTSTLFQFGANQAESPAFNALALLFVTLLAGQAIATLNMSKGARARRAMPWLLATTAFLSGLAAFAADASTSAGVYLGFGGLETARALSVGFGLQRSSTLMVSLVSFLGWMIFRFSANYLRSERAQPRFLIQLSWTVIAVELFALATSLVTYALVWLLISWGVHRLLRHYNERPVARLAARTKFLISRVADLVFWSSLILLFRTYGTLDVAELSNLAVASREHDLAIVGICLAVLMKSAQFPMHSWLPDTMDAPTPVSAIMHAGVINAGAYLLLQLSPLLEHSPAALFALALVGGLTAAFGILVGSLQPSVKAALAYSTIAQMGFLFFELGLGFPGAAALHLAAHGLFKAHAFLRSGSASRPPVSTPYSVAQTSASLALTLLITCSVLGIGGWALGVDPIAYLPLGIVWGLGLSQYFLVPNRSWATRLASLFGIGLTLLGFSLAAEATITGMFAPLPSLLTFGLLGPLVTFAIVALLAVTLILSTRARFEGAALEKLYVHALAGFYIGEVFDRIARFFWPDKSLHVSNSNPLKGIS